MPWKNQGGGPWGSGPKGPWGGGPQSSGPNPPDLEDIMRRSQDKLRSIVPGGRFGGLGVMLIATFAVMLWGLSGIFIVQPDEQGAVLRFGKYVRKADPGFNYHWPYPIENVLLAKALRVNQISIGTRVVEEGSTVRRGGALTWPEESLMLTGDENIVDVDFTVLWRIKPDDGVAKYLFNIQNPEGTVKAVAESAMREVIGRSNIQPILTGARSNIETAVHDLMQKTLDDYNSGILITQMQLQKVDPPTQVIDAFRDVQAARADLERAQNEAQTYANRVVPEARGRVAQILQGAEAYREQTVAEATGQTARFLKIYEEYKKAPDVTRQRIYLETMERVFAGTDKIILDSGVGGGRASCRTCRSTRCSSVGRLRRSRAGAAPGSQPMKSVLGVVAVVVGLIVASSPTRRSSPCVRPSRRWSCGSANRAGVITEPGLNFKVPLIETVNKIDNRILDLENPAQEVIASDQKRLVVDAFARYRIRDPLRFYQTVGIVRAANSSSRRSSTRRCAACSARRRSRMSCATSAPA